MANFTWDYSTYSTKALCETLSKNLDSTWITSFSESQKITEKLQDQLKIPVAFGMHYSAPSIKKALFELQSKNVNKIVVLPLYPQYSGTTTASSFDAIAHVLKTWRSLPEIRTINH